jgi:hypothetical protein
MKFPQKRVRIAPEIKNGPKGSEPLKLFFFKNSKINANRAPKTKAR